MNGSTPDGYTVNSDGAWTVNGVVQTKNVGVDTTRIDYKVQQAVDSGNISWPVTVKTADHSFYEYLGNEKFIALVESQFVLDNGGYNEDGISNAAIDILTHSREENKKYGELFVVEEEPIYGNNMTITYKNGMTRSYIHSNEKYRDTSTSHVYCTYSWWPSLKNKETYLFKYASGTQIHPIV